MQPTIEFHLQLPNSGQRELLKGFLLLKQEPNNRAGIKLQATSGCSGYQYSGSWKLKGRGPLPPSRAIEPLTYSVSTQRLWLPHVRGVEGSFYAIAPFSVKVDEGKSRGDFGIHFDANVPGSAGCIVFPLQDHWDVFRSFIANCAHKNVQQVPLNVMYTVPIQARAA
ncbi:hypothetical protein [Gloeocapsopsis dulcis]|uniref:DUF2778 domain-containing protein n=1 Tax=Gloeocapsopsis dulcis AAB1 = 1H9 TaxID=1433147 RepID=A0A6N8G6S6_9CHRO|nr:hypothetical protein [Gloeocapsopsis dulcis]MUL39316.1 hypothetical protein [Gloeocapsopsis dulcis AAB1 = 1H9]WNN91562.1 hypothetical protein P0S91_11010 [Gloeocapsopsis dulcis]